MPTVNGTLYPSLNRFFESSTALAHAGCMSRQRLSDCLNGTKAFTRAEKKAIAANIAVRIMDKPVIDYEELQNAVKAWKGQFDEIYRIKEGD